VESVRRYLARAPGTHIYLLILLITTATVHSLPEVLRDQLLRHLSTNLYEMGRSAIRVLLLSAFMLDDGRWFLHAVLFTAVYVPLERWIGSWRWLAVVVVGHVGATLVTTIGIWADVRYNGNSASLSRTIDVGVSYGFYAAAAFLMFAIHWPWLRATAATSLFGALLVPLVLHHTFTDAGHMAAWCIGNTMYVVMMPALRDRPADRLIPLGLST
jgi:hypothetical protein